ncbi:MAG: aspartate-semialdehyde dehydrogenase [Candidatus Riflebacteria bacterium]|jgi:aspartate-semialdehyde dehydrogenase|nr:aspartate-semialdehyde dehydrogenase [Candidatus Riflebacteria bacterium]
MNGHNIGIVGATGAVGLKILKVLDERVKDIQNLRLFASERSAGQQLEFRGKRYQVEDTANSDFTGLDVVFFSAGTEVSLKYCPIAVKAGALVIDNTNAHRMNPDVPLVVPEANLHAVKNHKGLIANPNCSTIQMIVALAPIHRVNPIRRIVVSTYQSVSGTGLEAIDILKKQSEAILAGKEPPEGVYPHPIAFNLIPQIDILLESGLYREEDKMVKETCKILESDIKVCPTTVRVPVMFCHSESVNIELSEPMTLAQVKSILAEAEDIVMVDDPARSVYPTPLACQDRDEVFVGRLRVDPTVPSGFNMWIVADNLRRGAATNAVKIYTEMVRNGLF